MSIKAPRCARTDRHVKNAVTSSSSWFSHALGGLDARSRLRRGLRPPLLWGNVLDLQRDLRALPGWDQNSRSALPFPLVCFRTGRPRLNCLTPFPHRRPSKFLDIIGRPGTGLWPGSAVWIARNDRGTARIPACGLPKGPRLASEIAR